MGAFRFILEGNLFMPDFGSTGPAIPPRVKAYVDTIVRTCAEDGRALVSVVLFGSAAIGGWVESVSDVDLVLVVPDTTASEAIDSLRKEVGRIEALQRLGSEVSHGQAALERFFDRLTARDRTFFICKRSDLLSGNIGRILCMHPFQAIFVDRTVLANFVDSGITIWGEAMLPLISVARIRRFDVFKGLFSLLPMTILCAAIFPLHPGMTKCAMGLLKGSIHSCFFCYELRRAPLEEEIRFFERRLGPNRTFKRLLDLRREYRSSFPFVARCIPTLVWLHFRTAIDNRFPRGQ